jgi:Asp-tRNA(Asn)/Glu-tRNA(Gln) amidotransferase A subunit family amidase
MPYGIQIMADRFKEDKMFAFAKFIEEIKK